MSTGNQPVRRGDRLYTCTNRECHMSKIVLGPADSNSCPLCGSPVGHIGWAVAEPSQYIPVSNADPNP